MSSEDDSMLELFGALTSCLSRAIATMTLAQLNDYETEVLEMLRSNDTGPGSANAYKSVLRDIDSRRLHRLLR